MKLDVRPQKCYVCVEPAATDCLTCHVYLAREAELERLREHPELLPRAPGWWWD